MEQLSNDPFMKQVEYGLTLTTALNAGSDESTTGNVLQDALAAQLSHSDGIRGFMVSYLTSDDSPADQIEIPIPLLQTLETQMIKDSKTPTELISLACT
jgi:hypothetical protein